MIINFDRLGQGGGSGSGSTVNWAQEVTGGTEIAKITIDGTTQNVYAPEGGGGIEVVAYEDLDTAKCLEIYTNPTNYLIFKDDRYFFPSYKDGYCLFINSSMGTMGILSQKRIKIDTESGATYDEHTITGMQVIYDNEIENYELAIKAHPELFIIKHTGLELDIDMYCSYTTSNYSVYDSQVFEYLTSRGYYELTINHNPFSYNTEFLPAGGYTAGENITISGNTISAVDTTYVAGEGIEISGNTISCTVSGGTGNMKIYYLNSMTDAQRDALRRELYAFKDSASESGLSNYVFYIEHPNKDEYNAPIRVYVSRFEYDSSVENVKICFSGIFASRSSRKFWSVKGLKINNNGALTSYSFEEYNIDNKQDRLTAGRGIEISGGTISSTPMQIVDNTYEITNPEMGTIAFAIVSDSAEPDMDNQIEAFSQYTGEMATPWTSTGSYFSAMATSNEGKTLFIQLQTAGQDYDEDTIEMQYDDTVVATLPLSSLTPNGQFWLGMIGLVGQAQVYTNADNEYFILVNTYSNAYMPYQNWFEVKHNYVKDYFKYGGIEKGWEPLLPNIDGKQDKLTAGNGISIVNNVISATGGGGGGTAIGFYTDNEIRQMTSEQQSELYQRIYNGDLLAILNGACPAEISSNGVTWTITEWNNSNKWFSSARYQLADGWFSTTSQIAGTYQISYDESVEDINNPYEGLMVYHLASHKRYLYDGEQWVELTN